MRNEKKGKLTKKKGINLISFSFITIRTNYYRTIIKSDIFCCFVSFLAFSNFE